ncbi:GreA/GreB family elongation factor [Patescibacteria group bacterium]|nr:GreA/GreB family elongation factor [Patescibacteria group bacterium]
MTEKIFYITKEKFGELKKEYEDLLIVELNKTKGDTPKPFESEDINPEYVNFQEDMESLRLRINDLGNILKSYEIIKKSSSEKQNSIGLGSAVTLEINGRKDEFVIVGTLEANPALGKISNESPVGSALLGHRVGDKITIFTPIKKTYTVKRIKYFTS